MTADNGTYTGSCHCGAIGYRLHTAIPPSEWSVRACQCTFCRNHDALSTSDPAGRIEFQYRNTEKLQRYRFGLKTADFLLCRNCGVYIGAFIETPTGEFAIINTHSLKPQPDDMAAVQPISYDGEKTGGRIKRREERWTPASESIVSD